MSATDRVFVYGTLRQDQPNHPILQRARYLGTCRTAPGYTLYDLGPYPAAVAAGQERINGEVYAIDRQTLAALDQLEGYPHYYDRRRVDTPIAAAWIYLLPWAEPHWRRVRGGDWLAHLHARNNMLEVIL